MTDSKSQVAEIRVLLLPLQEDNLVLPNATVVEVISTELNTDLTAVQSKVPDWLVGSTDWRQRKIPVISFEKMTTNGPEHRGFSSRVAICHSLANENESFIGIQMQGIPKLLLLTESDIKDVLAPDLKPDWPVVSGMQFNDVQAWIPDIDALRKQVETAWVA